MPTIPTRPASPAAAASVTRILEKAGLKRALEFQPGVELQGFYASPNADHVRVEYVPGPLAEETEHMEIILSGLEECEKVLRDKFTVKSAQAELAYPGEFRLLPVLEIRSERWGR